MPLTTPLPPIWISTAFAAGAATACLGLCLLTRRSAGPWQTGAAPLVSWVVILLAFNALLLNLIPVFVGITGGRAIESPAGVEQLNLWTIGILGVFMMLGVAEAIVLRVREQQASRLTTSLARARGELRHLASHDVLTGLTNRRAFMDVLTAQIDQADRDGARFAVLHVALDRFKTVNASLGQDVGDDVLRLCGRRIATVLRPTDRIARVGGDEFAVLLPGLATADQLAVIAQRVLVALNAPAEVGSSYLRLSASIGAAVFPESGATASDLLSNAVAAVNAVKSSGRGGIQVFAESMSRQLRDRVDLESDLANALVRNEFELHYQPVISLEDGRFTGMEALVRWRHPTRGLVPPNDFIGLAEENGLIVALGEWVLREACRQTKAWLDEGIDDLKISVNMSAVQFRGDRVIAMVERALHDTGLPAELLTIEVTESTVMTQAEESVAKLERLSEMGVSLAIDDFGTGYSSLSYLRRFPIDMLKVDRSFILDATRSVDAASIVRAVVSMAHGLRLMVVAEGVEDTGQRDFLRSLGCQCAQGYLFSRPVPPLAFRELMLQAREPAHSAAMLQD